MQNEQQQSVQISLRGTPTVNTYTDVDLKSAFGKAETDVEKSRLLITGGTLGVTGAVSGRIQLSPNHGGICNVVIPTPSSEADLQGPEDHTTANESKMEGHALCQGIKLPEVVPQVAPREAAQSRETKKMLTINYFGNIQDTLIGQIKTKIAIHSKDAYVRTY